MRTSKESWENMVHHDRKITGKFHWKITGKSHQKTTGKFHRKITEKPRQKVTGKYHRKITGKFHRKFTGNPGRKITGNNCEEQWFQYKRNILRIRGERGTHQGKDTHDDSSARILLQRQPAKYLEQL